MDPGSSRSGSMSKEILIPLARDEGKLKGVYLAIRPHAAQRKDHIPILVSRHFFIPSARDNIKTSLLPRIRAGGHVVN